MALETTQRFGTPCRLKGEPGKAQFWIGSFFRLQLCALYAVTDVALVTSLRDGMNLVSYEYVACQSDNAGAVRV